MGSCFASGVESTGSDGAGITRHLALSGVPVLEVTGPDRAGRRAKGKDDSLDAVAAAEAARTGRRVQVAKDRAGAVEALRVLRTTRKTAVKCRRATLHVSGYVKPRINGEQRCAILATTGAGDDSERRVGV